MRSPAASCTTTTKPTSTASPGEYFPEIIHLAKLDRTALVSGWDIDGSLDRIIRTGSRLTDGVQELTASAAVDHNLGTMFMRMNDIARRIALISLLVSLPLLLMAGILLGQSVQPAAAQRAAQARACCDCAAFRAR